MDEEMLFAELARRMAQVAAVAVAALAVAAGVAAVILLAVS